MVSYDPHLVIERPELLRLFAQQHHVATVEQLHAHGLSRSSLTRRRADGTLSTVIPGVVRLAGAPDTFESQAMALQLHCGPVSFLSGVTAGALCGLRAMPRRRLEITISLVNRVRCPPWARFVGSSWIDLDRDTVVRPDGLRVASPMRMMFGLAAQFNQYRFERAAEDAWHLGLVTPSNAADYLSLVRRSGRSGVARFERWLEAAIERPRPSQSGLELDFVDYIRRAGLPEPERQHPLRLADGRLIHIDLAWPAAQLGVEPGHSWWHGGEIGQRSDQARDRACDEVGWRIIRYDEHDGQDGRGLQAQLVRIYRQRLGLLSRGTRHG